MDDVTFGPISYLASGVAIPWRSLMSTNALLTWSRVDLVLTGFFALAVWHFGASGNALVLINVVASVVKYLNTRSILIPNNRKSNW